MALISCENVAFAYDSGTVVSGLNFSVNAGDYLCIAGENGSGKSTLIKGILRLIYPSAGTVSLGGGLRAGHIGYLPQMTETQENFPASAREVVLSGRLNKRGIRPFYTKEDKAAAHENMELLGVQALEGRCFRELSGGQRRRVLLARALCATGKLLLLDEPVAGLDPAAAQTMYETIRRVNKDAGITVVMVSHDLQNAAQYASHILHLKSRQTFFGTAADYFRTDEGSRFIGDGGSHYA